MAEKKDNTEKVEKKRREFIQYSTLGVLGLVLGGGVIASPYLNPHETRLRPPGAVDEHTFLGLCIKCGQCEQVCPYHSIHLADIFTGAGEGTPYIDARKRACYACEAVPCVLACPSGALDHSCEKATDIRMGIAVLEFPDSCIAMSNTPVPKKHIQRMHTHPNTRQLEQDVLDKVDAFEGKQCSMCADICPLPNPMSAIAMVPDKNGGRRPEIYDGCIGCGVCEEVCPVDSPAIVVKPRLTYEDYYEKGIRS